MEINIKNDFDIKLISTNKLIKEVENLQRRSRILSNETKENKRNT